MKELKVDKYGGFDELYDFESYYYPDEMESIIEEAYNHTIMENSLRKEIQKRYTGAIDQVRLGWPFKYSRKFIVMNYSQNIYIPNFGGEGQVLLSYFWTTNVYQFIIVKCTTVHCILY